MTPDVASAASVTASDVLAAQAQPLSGVQPSPPLRERKGAEQSSERHHILETIPT